MANFVDESGYQEKTGCGVWILLRLFLSGRYFHGLHLTEMSLSCETYIPENVVKIIKILG